MKKLTLLLVISASFVAARIDAVTIYNNDFPTHDIAVAARPDTASAFEIEAGDDFLLTSPARITGATFTGLVPQNFNLTNIGNVILEIYRVFPKDSDVGRTSGPPTFMTPNVPTRVNSPSDVAFEERSTAAGNLGFVASILNATFTTNNSVQPGGIHPQPNQTTGGDGAFTGQEVHFDITFSNPFSLPADHYFFVPQVELTGTDGTFLWLSAERPISQGTPFPPGVTDLQAWTRDVGIEPDWLRVGTDIVGGSPAPTFNTAFSVSGTVPDTASTALLLGGALLLIVWLKRRVLIN